MRSLETNESKGVTYVLPMSSFSDPLPIIVLRKSRPGSGGRNVRDRGNVDIVSRRWSSELAIEIILHKLTPCLQP